MKKINLILLVSFVLSIVSCGSEESNESSSSKNEELTEVQSDSKAKNEDENGVSTDSDNSLEDNTTSSENSSIHQDDDPIFSVPVPPIEDGKPLVIKPDLTDVAADTYNFHSYKDLNSLLSTYVSSSGKVNYAGIKSKASKLKAILKEFQDNYPQSNWSNNQKLSYWINAYNIFTIKLIVDNYPTSSITKITDKPWHKKFIKLNGSTISLDHIENGIIRKKFNEPRIHFALNCASKSCPVLLNAAYTPDNLQSKLTSQTKRFLNDSSKNKFGSNEIFISKIFDWYKADFTKNGTVIDFINKYRTEQLSSPTIKYSEYSWDLNN